MSVFAKRMDGVSVCVGICKTCHRTMADKEEKDHPSIKSTVKWRRKVINNNTLCIRAKRRGKLSVYFMHVVF